MKILKFFTYDGMIDPNKIKAIDEIKANHIDIDLLLTIIKN